MKVNPGNMDRDFLAMIESLGGVELIEKMFHAMMKDPAIHQLYQDALKENPDMDLMDPETLSKMMKEAQK